MCKSAGTLLLLGANEFAFSEHGELGPLDIQMAKKDELWDFESGLTVMTALTALHESAQSAFDHFLMTLTSRSRGRLTARTASEIAAKLTEALYSRISEQIDPIHIGEVNRSMEIARQYGQRLIDGANNCKEGALDALLGGYPSHGFCIDKKEAELLFRSVRDCTQNELALLQELGNYTLMPSASPWVKFISDDILEEDSQDANPTSDTILEQQRANGSIPQAVGTVPATAESEGVGAGG
jgi:hypothetical protein